MSDTLNDMRTRIPPLDQDDITNWLLDIKVVLMGKKRAHLALDNPRPEWNNEGVAMLQGAAALRRYDENLKEEQTDWDERNDISVSAIMESAQGPNCLEAKQLIKEKLSQGNTARQITAALVARFDSNDPRVVNALMKNWTHLDKIRGEKATSYITRLNEKRSELAKKGKVFTNGELVGRLLDGLAGDETYAANVAAMHTIPNLQYEEAVKQLRYKDTVDGLSKTTVAALTSAKSMAKPTATNQGQTNTGKVTCQICSKPGHSARICHFRHKTPDKNTQQQKQGQKRRDAPRDMSKVKCYNCNKMGHFADKCNLPDKRKTSNSSNSNTNSDEHSNKKQRTNQGTRVSFDDDVTPLIFKLLVKANNCFLWGKLPWALYLTKF